MRILFFTDVHLTNRIPASRVDNYPQTILAKVREVGEIARARGVDIIVNGGDVFHSPAVERGLSGELAEIIRSFPAPVYVVPGNHDLFGQNPDTLNQTMLGLLIRSGVFRLLDRDHPIITDEVIIEGQPYYPGIDRKNKAEDYGFRRKDSSAYKILVAHGMLLPKPMPDDVPVTLFDEVPDEADLILVGHYHPGFPVHKPAKGPWIVNVGALARTDAGFDNYRRQVQVLVITIQDGKAELEIIPIKSAPQAEEVLSRAALEEKKARAKRLEAFHRSLAEIRAQKNSFAELLEQALEGRSEEVREEVGRQIREAHKSIQTDELPSPKARRVIDEIELVNFQGHAHTKLELSPGLNAIVGPSNKGKSAIFRAFRWLAYNEPKRGVERIIRIGQDRALVRVRFDDGTVVERARPAKKSTSGSYRVISPEGDTQELTGFGSSVPPAVQEATGHFDVPLAPGLERRLLMSGQHDGLFFLSETGSSRAAIIGRLSGTDVADEAIKNIASEISSLNRERKRLLEDRETLLAKLREYDDLELERERIEALERELKRLEELQATRAELERLHRDYQVVVRRIDEAERFIAKLPDLAALKLELARVKELRTKQGELADLLKRHDAVARKLEAARAVIERMPDLEVLSEAVSRAQKLQEERAELEELAKSWQSVTQRIEKAESRLQVLLRATQYGTLLEQASSLHEKRQELEEILREYNKIKKAYKQAKARAEDATARLGELQDELEAVLEEAQVCPVCHRPFDQDTIHQLVKKGA